MPQFPQTSITRGLENLEQVTTWGSVNSEILPTTVTGITHNFLP